MTDAKLLRVVSALEALLGDPATDPDMAELAHLRSMFPRLRAIIAEGRREKAMRWVGFIQGALWAYGLADLETLKKMNMADGDVYDASRDAPTPTATSTPKPIPETP